MKPPEGTAKKESWEYDAVQHLHIFAGLHEQAAPKEQIDLAQTEYLDFIRTLMVSERELLKD